MHTHTATLYMGNLCEKRCQNMHWDVCVCVGICMYVNLFAAIRINSGHNSTLCSTVLCHCASSSSLLKIITSHTQAASYLKHTHTHKWPRRVFYRCCSFVFVVWVILIFFSLLALSPLPVWLCSCSLRKVTLFAAPTRSALFVQIATRAIDKFILHM